ncbi:NADH-quinone oxidoreductase subunit L [Phorcysia thermohydrogeniphila]|uniref:NADH dehydrogenase subunit L n=1 Tax=Phorcysia thermohydrogeniphila TaxID=936138 RepID=A0A4R1GB51_9BACT|nr:NADH-quinone oxidoreductase subunit L [Phorcysia thermohydrogeniphila]TCK03921.1 NADH dehydrogenase subunit L [Phorcysia thermohydrogeniphila]
MEKLVYLTIAVFFVGSILSFLVGKFTSRWNSFWVAVITGALGFGLTSYVALNLGERPLVHEFEWFRFGSFSVPLGIYVDHLAIVMAIIATGIGLLDIVFSKGYMEEDESPHRYYFEKLFFIGSMVGLVFVSNLVGLYIFWEGVGLCSYLLIGYWYWKKSAAEAALKAFVMTRFGDVFMLAGIIVAYVVLGTINFQELNALAVAGAFSVKLGLLISILIFIGAIGKSAQFPLFPWLLDAMEGPTTVSALIHAATMVNAGIYLVARMFPFFDYSQALIVVAFVGALSAFIAATGALAHTEIKKVLAFSTMEHLALMFVGLGVGSAAAGIFHLMNHAIFKALLFLAAGAVIHMTHHTKDAFKLGGLKKYMPQTALLFLVGVLALSGIPPLNGFFSKDWILAETFHFNPVIFGLTFVAGVLAIFYGFRLWFVIFTGEPSEASKHAKEAYPVMLVPLYVLAAFTFITAFFKEDIVHFLFGEVHEPFYANLLVATLTVMFFLFMLAYLIYYKRSLGTSKLLAHPMGEAVNVFLYKGWLVDDAIKWVCRKVFYGSIAKAVEWVDTNVVDGAVNGVASLSLYLWDKCRKIQTGDLVNYLTYFALGVIAISLIILFV